VCNVYYTFYEMTSNLIFPFSVQSAHADGLLNLKAYLGMSYEIVASLKSQRKMIQIAL
jgi:hypothetical protein